MARDYVNRRYDIDVMDKINVILHMNPTIYVRDLPKYVDISVGSAYNYIRKYVDNSNEIKEIDIKHRNRLQQSRLLHYLVDKCKDVKILNVRI